MQQESRTFSLTRAGRSYLRFLNAYNTNDPVHLRKFIAENFAPDFLQTYPVKDMVDWCRNTFKITGKMQVRKVFFTEEFYIIVIVKASDGTLYLDKMKLVDKPPHHIIEYFHENT